MVLSIKGQNRAFVAIIIYLMRKNQITEKLVMIVYYLKNYSLKTQEKETIKDIIE